MTAMQIKFSVQFNQGELCELFKIRSRYCTKIHKNRRNYHYRYYTNLSRTSSSRITIGITGWYAIQFGWRLRAAQCNLLFNGWTRMTYFLTTPFSSLRRYRTWARLFADGAYWHLRHSSLNSPRRARVRIAYSSRSADSKYQIYFYVYFYCLRLGLSPP